MNPPEWRTTYRRRIAQGRLLSVAAAMLIYIVNAVFMTAVQVGGAAVALALA
jgi:hypothetical protein